MDDAPLTPPFGSPSQERKERNASILVLESHRKTTTTAAAKLDYINDDDDNFDPNAEEEEEAPPEPDDDASSAASSRPVTAPQRPVTAPRPPSHPKPPSPQPSRGRQGFHGLAGVVAAAQMQHQLQRAGEPPQTPEEQPEPPPEEGRRSMGGGSRTGRLSKPRDSVSVNRRVGSVAVPSFAKEEDKGPVLGGGRQKTAMQALSRGQAGSLRKSFDGATRADDFDDADSSSDSSSDEEADAARKAEEAAKTKIGEGDRESLLLSSLVSDAARASKIGDRRVRVPDTILFKNGVPFCWLFLDRRGRLRRKHGKRLHWNEIRYAIQESGRRHREGGPEAPVAVLRWRTSKPFVDLPNVAPVIINGHRHKPAKVYDNSPLAVTLLDWRDLKVLDEKIPAAAGPNLKSWTQFVALQPLVHSHAGSHSCVHVHGHAVRHDQAPGAQQLPSRPGLPGAGETRELMNWPGPAPRRGREPEQPGSAKCEDPELHEKLERQCELIAARAETSQGATCGGPVVLSKSLGIRSFIAEFVFDAKLRPILLFVRHVVLRPVGNHARRKNAWRTVKSFVSKVKHRPPTESFEAFTERVRKTDAAEESSKDADSPAKKTDEARGAEAPPSRENGTLRATARSTARSTQIGERVTVRKRTSVLERARISKFDRERKSKIDAERRASRQFRMRHSTLNSLMFGKMTDPG